MAGQAPRGVARDVEDIETITNGLTQTILGDNPVNTNLAVATPARTDDIDTITNRLGEAILGEDENQRLVTLPAEEEKAVGGGDQAAKLNEVRSTENEMPEKESTLKAKEREDEVRSAENHVPEKANRPKSKEGEDAINALGAACSSWSLEDDEEAEARREAQQLKEQIRMKHGENMETLEKAEAKRRADEECNAFERQLQADIDGARLHKMKRKARKEKNKETARQLRIAAEAEKIAIAERRARQERRAHEEALELQAKREADNRARLELSEVYNRIFYNSVIAEANARQVQAQRQREAELIAQYHQVLLQQAQLADLERRQQEEQFFQQHYVHPSNWQVPESSEEMDTGPEAEACEATEMDIAPEMEASGGGEMEWQLEEEKSRLPTELLPPSSPPAPEPSAPAQGLPSPDTSLTTAKETDNKARAENSSNRSSATMAPLVVTSTSEPAARAHLYLQPLREASKARRTDTRSQAFAASPASPQAAAQAATSQPSLAPAPPPSAVLPVARSPAPAPQSPAAPAAPAAPVAPVAPAASAVPPSPSPPPMPAPPLTPSPARPAPSNQRTLTIVCKNYAVINPTLAAIRPTVNAWSPLGRLLSQHKAIPKATMTQVLGKRTREDGGEGGREKKMRKFEGEFRLQVGGKRKREGEEFPGKKRAFLSRALAVPCSRFAASQATNSAVPPPILTPDSTLSNHPPTPAPFIPSAASPSVLEPLQANPHRGLAEAMELYNDLPTLRREIAWMRAQRQIATSRKKTRGNGTSISKKATERTATQASYWSKYRENLSR